MKKLRMQVMGDARAHRILEEIVNTILNIEDQSKLSELEKTILANCCEKTKKYSVGYHGLNRTMCETEQLFDLIEAANKQEAKSTFHHRWKRTHIIGLLIKCEEVKDGD